MTEQEHTPPSTIEAMASAGYDALAGTAVDRAMIGVPVCYAEIHEKYKEAHRTYIRAALQALHDNASGAEIEAGARAIFDIMSPTKDYDDLTAAERLRLCALARESRQAVLTEAMKEA